jgi:hypothetical protein
MLIVVWVGFAYAGINYPNKAAFDGIVESGIGSAGGVAPEGIGYTDGIGDRLRRCGGCDSFVNDHTQRPEPERENAKSKQPACQSWQSLRPPQSEPIRQLNHESGFLAIAETVTSNHEKCCPAKDYEYLLPEQFRVNPCDNLRVVGTTGGAAKPRMVSDGLQFTAMTDLDLTPGRV